MLDQSIQYVGEHLLPGKIGYFLIILAFVASLLSAVAYFFATQKRDLPEARSWLRMGRWSFAVHGIGIFIAISVLFYIMIKQYYEYQYVQAHVSDDLPMRFIFSAFWEGQEGSFLLWLFWHIVLGFILMRTAKSWEAPVLSIVALVQMVIISMVLGVYLNIGGTELKIGSSPLLLLRDVMDIPLFASPDYVELIKGKGLNPLLQNYWMTIHPPTLFLGFASTLVPFAYAMAGLWTGKHKEWLQPVLPWALFSACILGTGILMGGAWAYEALSFGGYWAWDPVENASLVPWILLVAGIHTNLIAKATGHSIKSSYLFYLLTFIFIVYSTTLTRSGILGDTSVHAFTEMGLEAQLVIFISLFSLLSAGAFIKAYKRIPSIEQEEKTSSREFWMFIGALVLLFSAILITFTTSIPLYKKVGELVGLELNITSPLEPVSHYNKYQLWIAVFVGLLSGIAQYLRFKEFNWNSRQSKFWKRMGVLLGLSALLSFLTALWIDISTFQYGLLLFAGIFTVICNLDYLVSFLKGNLKIGASTIAHIGFGIMIIGILASGLNKRYISSNPFVQKNFIPEEMLLKNVMLIKGIPMFMNGYEVTYVKDSLEGFIRSFEVDFKKKGENGQILEQFQVYPNIQYTSDFTDMAAPNPSTKRYLHKDIFTHIPNLPAAEVNAEARKEREDSLNYQLFTSGLGQPFVIEDSTTKISVQAIVEGIDRNPKHPEYHPQENDIPLGINLLIQDPANQDVFRANPMVLLRGNLIYNYPEQVNELSMKIRLTEDLFDQVFTPDDRLDYSNFNFKEKSSINFNGYNIQFYGFKKDVEHPQYKAQADDVAVSAIMQVTAPNDKKLYYAQPLYFIRGNRPFNLRDQIAELGLHFRFTGIDPGSGTISMKIAQAENANLVVPLEIATNSFRTDYIIFEAIEFPGINLFWLGSVMMLFGIGLGMWNRRKSLNVA